MVDQKLNNNKYYGLVRMPSANMFFRNILLNKDKSIYYYKKGMSAEAVMFNILTDMPLYPTNNVHVLLDYSRLCDKIGALLFYSIRLNYNDVDKAIKYLDGQVNVDISDIICPEINDLLHEVTERYPDMHDFLCADYDKVAYKCVDDFVDIYKPESNCVLNFWYDDYNLGVTVQGSTASEVKRESENIYLTLGKYISNDFTGRDYITTTHIFDKDLYKVLSSDFTSYIGIMD